MCLTDGTGEEPETSTGAPRFVCFEVFWGVELEKDMNILLQLHY